MKKKLSQLLFLVMLITGFSIAPAQAIPTVSLNVLDSDIAIGETFDVEVWADGDGIGQELLAFGFDVFTAGTYFSYDGYTIESGFDDDSFGPNNVAGSSFPGVAADDVLLATLSFTALGAGSDTLSVLGLYDGFFSGLFYEFDGHDIDASVDITVGSRAPVPEPSTILLLSSGLIGFIVNRKRKRS